MAIAANTLPNGKAMTDVIDAMRNFQSQGDIWKLADALAKKVPSGDQGLEEIMDTARGENVLGKLTLSTIRQYRDASHRWPKANRIDGLSFTAHREVMNAKDAKDQKLSDDEKIRLLEGLIKKAGGPDKVRTIDVRDAVRSKAKKPTSVQRAATKAVAAGVTNQSAQPFDVLADIKRGAVQLIAAIGKDTSESDLNKILKGLQKASEHTADLKAKAAGKRAAATQKAAAKSTPTASKSNGNGDGTVAPAARRRRGMTPGL